MKVWVHRTYEVISPVLLGQGLGQQQLFVAPGEAGEAKNSLPMSHQFEAVVHSKQDFPQTCQIRAA